MDNHQFIKINPPRQLLLDENNILKKLLTANFKGNSILLDQIKAIRVSEECKFCHSIRFIVKQVDIEPASDMKNLPVEAEGKDQDGAPIHILLFVVNGLLDEMSVFREDIERVKELPNSRDLEITVW
jgi:hypothetical protein